MKHIVWIILIIISQNAFSYENIYEDAITQFIKQIINEQELSRIERGKDSIYNHTLIFESSEFLNENKLLDIINEYKIQRVKSVKEFLNLLQNGCITIFAIGRLEYCETCTAKFSVPFYEYTIVKNKSKILIRNIDIHCISYVYNCKTNTFKYKYCNSSRLGYVSNDFLKKKGWID